MKNLGTIVSSLFLGLIPKNSGNGFVKQPQACERKSLSIEYIRSLGPEELKSKFEVRVSDGMKLGFGSKRTIDFSYYLDSMYLGYSTIFLDKNEKTIDFHDFYPYHGLDKAGGSLVGILARATTAIKLVELFGVDESYSISFCMTQSDSGAGLLRKIGVAETKSFKEYMDKVLGYASQKGLVFKNPLG